LLECLEKKSVDAVCKKRMENRFRLGLVSTDLLTVERSHMCILCLSPLTGNCARMMIFSDCLCFSGVSRHVSVVQLLLAFPVVILLVLVLFLG